MLPRDGERRGEGGYKGLWKGDGGRGLGKKNRERGSLGIFSGRRVGMVLREGVRERGGEMEFGNCWWGEEGSEGGEGVREEGWGEGVWEEGWGEGVWEG